MNDTSTPDSDGMPKEQTNYGSELEHLTVQLRLSPKQCPACGGTDIRRISNATSIVCNRECKECSCLWSPQWSRANGYTAAVLGFAIAGGCLIVGPLGIWQLWTGEYAQQWDLTLFANKVRAYVGPFAALICFPLMVKLGLHGVGVLRGTKGQPTVRRIGSKGEGLDDGRP
ncbi:MAG: hypothetical protein GY794_06500 [bacterium]|nr:hypothetical protein [bacterium]